MLESAQIFETINTGLVVLSANHDVIAWNRWMEQSSGIQENEIVGRPLYDFYPNMAEPKYKRLIKSVFTFGHYAYFSQKLHRYLFPMQNSHSSVDILPYMQQSCTAGPLRNNTGKIDSIFIAVQDVTENVAIELRLKQKIVELEDALATVKLLEGIIPICMYCKKIRDDEESWQQMERYITEHSAAKFSHGICPECFSKKPWKDK
jgi:PAS domain S-box-containing protein